MDFKKKAGLALALAAIFTTGGANLALAANTTSGADLSGNTDIADNNGNIAYTTNDPTINGGTGNADPINTVTVSDDTTVATLQGILNFDGDGGVLVGNSQGAVDLDVAAGGIVNLGKATNVTTTAGTLGDMTYINAGELNVNNGDYTAGNIDVNTGQLDLVVDRDAALTVGNLNLGTADATSTIKVGLGALIDETVSLIVNGVFTQGGTSFIVDPVWATTGTNYATVAISDLAANQLTDEFTVGRNSRATIGVADKNWLDTVIAQTGRTWQDDGVGAGLSIDDAFFSAALGLNRYNTITLATAGEINVDNDVTALQTNGAGTVSFAEDSALVINAGKLYTDDYTNAGPWWEETLFAITGTGAAGDIDNDANLVLVNAKAGTRINILDNFDLTGYDSATSTGWMAGDNRLMSDVNFLTGHIQVNRADTWTGGANQDLSVVVDEVTVADVRDAFPALSGGMASMITNIYNEKANNTDDYVMMDDLDDDEATSPTHEDDPSVGNTINDIDDLLLNNAGLQFVSRAVSNTYGSFNGVKAGAAILEGAAQIAVAGGVPYLTNNVITRVSDLVVDHNEMLDASQPAYGNEPGKFALWVTPFYGMSDIDGMDAGRFDNALEMNYGGAAFGFDYNINEAFRVGAALNLGSGDVDSDDGGFNDTNNDFDFFGGNLYGSWTNGAFGLTGDLGYTTFDNEIEQDLPAAMGMGSKLRSDVDSDAFTVGLTGKYRFAASDNFNIAPHLGLRYTKISIDDTDVDLANGRNIFKVDTEDQNLFQIPLGVEFSGNVVTGGGWTVKPKADLGVLFTAGDTDVDSRARITNTGYGAFRTGTINAEVIDEVAFTGALGVQAAADNGMSLGLDYNLLASGNQTDHQFSGMLRFEF